MTSEEKKLKKALQELSRATFIFLRRLDETMKLPDSAERGKTIAALSNVLEMANDKARYFALGIDYRKDDKDKEWAKIIKNYLKV